MKVRGWVYVISNAAMPALLKIGFSTKDPIFRAEELNNTGNPHPYRVEYDLLVYEPYDLEQKVHRHLSSSREGKEWFKCSLPDAVRAITSLAVEHLPPNICQTDLTQRTYDSRLKASTEVLIVCPTCKRGATRSEAQSRRISDTAVRCECGSIFAANV